MNRRGFAASVIGLLLAPLGFLGLRAKATKGPVWYMSHVGARDDWDVPSLPDLPPGYICVWSGDDIPAGWALCDGMNGTPDLREMPPCRDAWRAGPSDPWLYIIKQ